MSEANETIRLLIGRLFLSNTDNREQKGALLINHLESLNLETNTILKTQVINDLVNLSICCLNMVDSREQMYLDKVKESSSKINSLAINLALGGERSARMLKEVKTSLENLETELTDIKHGYKRRADQVDKADFQEWVKDENIVIERITDLWNIRDINHEWLTYSKDILKSWYKEVQPSVKLKNGRPKN